MRCPECGYTSFDDLENCKKCGSILSSKESTIANVPDDLDVQVQTPLPLPSLKLPPKPVGQHGEPSTPRKERVFPSFLQSRDHDGNFITGLDEHHDRSFSMDAQLCAVDNSPHYVVRRIVATAVDLIVLMAIWYGFIVVGAWGFELPALDFLQLLFHDMSLRIAYYLILMVSLLAYFTLLHCAGQTVGKMVVKLTVVSENGGLPSLSEGLLRSAGGLLSLLCGGWGYFRVLFDNEQRGWNDRFAGTRVVANADQLIDDCGPLST